MTCTDKRTFIVNDDPVVRKVLEWHLTTLGYAVCNKAGCAEDAFSEVKVTRPDAVLMDIHLEGRMDGIDTALAIKKMYDLPVIFPTAPTTENESVRDRAVPPDGAISSKHSMIRTCGWPLSRSLILPCRNRQSRAGEIPSYFHCVFFFPLRDPCGPPVSVSANRLVLS